MYNNGNNAMKSDNENSSYTTSYEEPNYGASNQMYSHGNSSTADRLEQELFYGGNTSSNTRANYAQQPTRTRTMYAEPQREEDYNSYADYSEDELPSQTTMQFKDREQNPYQDFHEEYETPSERRYKISTKGKVIAAVYAIVIATILTLIVLNTRLLKNMDSQIAAQNAEINQLLQQRVELDETFNYVTSDEVIEQKAQELGMIHD